MNRLGPSVSLARQTLPQEATVESLVGRLETGDVDALADLFSFYEDRFHRMVDVRLHWSLRGRLDAVDVLQEAYLDARDRLQNFFSREKRSIFIWLRLIVLQRLQMLERFHLQASKRDTYREVPLIGNDRSEQFGVFSHELATSITSPSEAAVREESIALVARLLEGMEPIDREVLVLRHFEQLSNGEVAEVLDIGVTAASNRYMRALRRLKQQLEST